MSRPSVIKSVFWLTFSEILFNLSGYIIHAVAGRTLGPADYGRYSLVITLTTVIVVLIGNGIPTAMSKYLSEVFEKDPLMVPVIKRQGIRTQAILMITVTIVFFLSAPLIANLLHDSTLTPLFQLSSLIIPAFAAASFYFSYFTGLHLFHHQSALKSFRSVARVTVIVGLVLVYGLKGAIVGYILAPFFTFLLGIYLDKRTAKQYGYSHHNNVLDSKRHEGAFSRPSLEKQPRYVTNDTMNDNKFPASKLLSYAWPITLFMLFYEIFTSVDIYLVKAILRDDTATGLYNAALTIGRIPQYLFYALAIFLLPALSKLKSEDNPEKLGRLMNQSLRYAGIILIPTVIFIIAYAEPITHLFFGTKYLASVSLLQILVFGLSFLTLFYLLCSALNGIGKALLSMKLSLIGTAFNVALNLFLIRRYGMEGAAWATSVSAILTTLIAFIIFQKHIPTVFHWKKIQRTLLIGIVLWYGATFLPTSGNIFILYSLFLGSLYIGALFALDVLTTNDFPQLKK